jgi:SAM-dependent methyltransferase
MAFGEKILRALRRHEALLRAKTRFMIDALWCDPHGVFVKGWAHAEELPVSSLYLRSGASRVDFTFGISRPDVRPHYPTMHSDRCGFSSYLACKPFRPVFLGLVTNIGTTEVEIEQLPADHPQNMTVPERPELMDRFVSEMKAQGGVVVEVGARVVSPTAELQASRFRPECKFIGVDIHPAEGVDMVADAHFMSERIAPNSVNGVFSLAVMEHLAAPWLFAREINRVLKVGGYTLHSVPQAFPVHETPNDFWRVSDEGLKVLFGRSTGFEVVECFMAGQGQMILNPAMRYGPFLELPLHPVMAFAAILARKVADLPDGAVCWPLSAAESSLRSKEYPKHQGSSQLR